ncbi:hypothetical protein ACET3Z_027469 [Daucus carota]
MACLPIVSNDGFLISQRNIRASSVKIESWGGYRGVSCSFANSCCYSGCFPILGLYNCSKTRQRLVLDSKIRSVSNEKENTKPHLGNRVNGGLKKKFLIRLRPRLRLLSRRLRMGSVKCLLDRVSTYVRKNLKRVTISAAVTVVLGLCFLFLKLTAVPSPKFVPYSDLVMSLQSGSVTRVLFEEGSRRIYYNTHVQSGENAEQVEGESVLRTAEDGKSENGVEGSEASRDSMSKQSSMLKKLAKGKPSAPLWQYSTRKIDHDESYLLSLMRESGTSYASAPQSALASVRSIILTILTLWIPLTPLMWILYRQLSASNSPAKKKRPSNQVVSFEDVEGVDAAKVELMEIVLCLQGSIDYTRLGAKLPRGVLLVGPPGTGKTLLARAVAGEAGVPFFTVSASEFVEMFVGRGAARIRDLFSVARKSSPSIIFIDELDAVGGRRGRSFNDERDQTLNQLLTEMDGFDSEVNVIVIAATNRPEALDPALCRPGRFSRKVLVGEPDEDGRRKILAVHLRGIPLEEDTGLICDLVASVTQGFVGADLANIVNEAALLAARRGNECVAREDIMAAIERAKFGINDKQLTRNTISKEIGKLFPWMPSFIGKNDTQRNGTQGPLGYQTLS